MEVYPNRFRYE